MKTKKKFIGDIVLNFECMDEFDTKVTINGTPLCWITWVDVDKFVLELSEVLSKYKI
jgi:hypothetical protein